MTVKLNSKIILQLGLISIVSLTASCTCGVDDGKTHWAYSGESGPAHWGELEAKYEMCGKGKNQSPINLTGLVESELTPIAFDYGSKGSEILNNGHTVQVNIEPGSAISVNQHVFELKQFHFHAPSENQIEGKSFPLEGHFVHGDAKGNLAVVAVMYQEGQENAILASLWKQMPTHAGDKISLNKPISAAELLPASRDYYRFNGSLTTPPCSEGVSWLVMKQPVEVSAEQISAFSEVIHHQNNRPIQPTNARAVLK